MIDNYLKVTVYTEPKSAALLPDDDVSPCSSLSGFTRRRQAQMLAEVSAYEAETMRAQVIRTWAYSFDSSSEESIEYVQELAREKMNELVGAGYNPRISAWRPVKGRSFNFVASHEEMRAA